MLYRTVRTSMTGGGRAWIILASLVSVCWVSKRTDSSVHATGHAGLNGVYRDAGSGRRYNRTTGGRLTEL